MAESHDACGFPATNGPCQNPPTGEDGYCWLETHGDDPADSEPDGRGAPEGNDNAASVGAWSESFVSDFLRDDEIERVKNAADALGDPESAQELARKVAAICLEQFRRTGDDRFLRRYESVSDKFGLTPPEEFHVEHSGDLSVESDVVRVKDADDN